MNTHSLTKKSSLLEFLEFFKTRFSGTSTPLQGDSLHQGNSSSTQHMQTLRKLQQTYYLERRYFL
jgi:hypothetical protein